MSQKRDKFLIVSIHDVTPAHADSLYQIMNRLDEIGLNASSLLVVPNYHDTRLESDQTFISWLKKRQDRGDEIVQHGFNHYEIKPPRGMLRLLRRAIFTRGEGEFLGIEDELCDSLLSRGKTVFEFSGLSSEGFVAPAWLIESCLYPVLARQGFTYTTRQSSIVDIKSGFRIKSPAFVLRGSSKEMNQLSTRTNDFMLSVTKSLPVIRLAIHPVDLQYGTIPWFCDTIARLMETRKEVTYLQFLNYLRDNNLFDMYDAKKIKKISVTEN